MMARIHQGYLWLDRNVDLTIDLIHRITGLSKRGKDPKQFFQGKSKEKEAVAKMKKSHALVKG